MTGQTEEARQQRLVEGRCPTHGTSLCQIDSDDDYHVVECPRRDCEFVGWQREPHGPTLTALPDRVTPAPRQKQPRARRAAARQKLPLTYESPSALVVEKAIRNYVEQWGALPSWGAIARALDVDDEAIREPICELLHGGRVVVERDGYNLACRLDTFDSVIRDFIAAAQGTMTPLQLRERLRGEQPAPRRRETVH